MYEKPAYNIPCHPFEQLPFLENMGILEYIFRLFYGCFYFLPTYVPKNMLVSLPYRRRNRYIRL